MIRLILALLFVSTAAFADPAAQDSQWVSPSTANVPPPAAPTTPGKKAPPECVKKVLSVIYARERDFFATKKLYSDSMLEIHALSAVGLGCPGWELPTVSVTYGGSGFNAVMTENATSAKWRINQDNTFILEEKLIAPTSP